jgi:ATP-dependent Lhr-like helicase
MPSKNRADGSCGSSRPRTRRSLGPWLWRTLSVRVLRAVVGILTPGARLPALTGNRVLYCDGVPIALFAGNEARFLEKLTPEAEWSARNALVRRQVPAVLHYLG